MVPQSPFQILELVLYEALFHFFLLAHFIAMVFIFLFLSNTIELVG